jgi:hypothetical protein
VVYVRTPDGARPMGTRCDFARTLPLLPARPPNARAVYACVAVRPSDDHVGSMEDPKKRSNAPIQRPLPEATRRITGRPWRRHRMKLSRERLLRRMSTEFLWNLRRNSILKTPTN